MHIGLIAGNGRFPFLVLDAARGAGHDVTVIALKEETFPDLAVAAARPPAAPVHWISLGELERCIGLLEAAGVEKAVMAGQVKHTRLFADIVPDLDCSARMKENTQAPPDGLYPKQMPPVRVLPVPPQHLIRTKKNTTYVEDRT